MVQSKAATPQEYVDAVDDDRKAAVQKLRGIIKKSLPKGFVEEMNYGMIGYVVPHKLYPDGYHTDPKLPLPFVNLAAQKNHIAVYNMGFADKQLRTWFEHAWKEATSAKLDMGGSCIRFKKVDDIPYALIGTLMTKVTPAQWIATYEANVKKVQKVKTVKKVKKKSR